MENNRRYKGDEGLVPNDFRSGEKGVVKGGNKKEKLDGWNIRN